MLLAGPFWRVSFSSTSFIFFFFLWKKSCLRFQRSSITRTLEALVLKHSYCLRRSSNTPDSWARRRQRRSGSVPRPEDRRPSTGSKRSSATAKEHSCSSLTGWSLYCFFWGGGASQCRNANCDGGSKPWCFSLKSFWVFSGEECVGGQSQAENMRSARSDWVGFQHMLLLDAVVSVFFFFFYSVMFWEPQIPLSSCRPSSHFPAEKCSQASL